MQHWKSRLRTALVGVVVFFGAAIAIYFALEPEPKMIFGAVHHGMPIAGVVFGVGGGAILSILAMVIDRSWQRQGCPKKPPELA